MDLIEHRDGIPIIMKKARNQPSVKPIPAL